MPAFPMLFLYVAGWHTMLFDIAAVCFHIYSHFLACCFCVCFSLCAFPFLLPYAVLSFVSLLFHPIQHHIHTMFAFTFLVLPTPYQFPCFFYAATTFLTFPASILCVLTLPLLPCCPTSFNWYWNVLSVACSFPCLVYYILCLLCMSLLIFL